MYSQKIIPIGCDHAGFELKQIIIQHLTSLNYEILDKGCYSSDSIDYPDFGHPVAEYVENHEGSIGIVLCGSGNGINMTVNKHAGIRSALCWNEEIVQLAREHNDANILAIPARFVSEELALKMVDKFLKTDFEGGRHQRRIDKIPMCK